MDLSDIQVKILTRFISAQELRYSEAKPEQVTNDLFKYHLKELIAKEYIQKAGEKYILTAKGKRFGYKISRIGRVEEPFFIAAMCLVIVEHSGEKEILLQKRQKHPTYGIIEAPAGKVRKGEKVEDSAKRKLLEESGLQADFVYRGTLRIIRYGENNELVNDQWFAVCYADCYTGELSTDTKLWSNYFMKLSDFLKLDDTSNSVRNLKTIIQKLDTKELFYIEDFAPET